MGRLSLAAVLMSFAVGCNVTAQGTIVDGMTGAPIAGMDENTPEGKGMRILFRAVIKGDDGTVKENMAAGGLCLVKEAMVGADGSYSVAELCSSATGYSIELSDKNLFLAETNSVDMGYDGTGSLDLKVWRAPKGAGVFELQGSELSRVKSVTDLRSDFVFASDEVLQSPKEIKSVPLIAAGEHLLLSGEAVTYEIFPLVNSGKRRLGKEANDKSEWVDQAPWSYVGVNFKSDTEIERLTTTVDESKVITKEKDGRTARYMGADSVAAGRYIILKKGGKRAWIVDFGEKGKNPGQ